jgi:heme exporter protein A
MLAADNLECVRGEQSLFQKVGFRLDAGELLLLRGANGVGKTSLLRMLCGLLPPRAGTIRWQGEDIRHLAGEYRAMLCYLGHLNAIKEEFTPLENLMQDTAFAGAPLSPAQALAALAEAGLAGRQDLPAHSLSQGQKRRVALARLIVDQRPLWLLDEPFVALDAEAVLWLAGKIGQHLEAGGLVVLTTHQIVEIPRAHVRELRLAPSGSGRA